MATDNTNGYEIRPSTEYFFAAFKDAFNHTWSKFLADDQKTEIVTFLTNDVTAFAMYMAFTVDGVRQLREQVFTNANVRDFILGVASAFYARISRMETEWAMLCERLVNSYSAGSHAVTDAVKDDYVAMPDPIAERMPDSKDVRGFIFSNRWLVVLCMIDQCITLGDVILLQPPGKKQK